MLLLTAVIGEAARSRGPSCTDPSGERQRSPGRLEEEQRLSLVLKDEHMTRIRV